jgi:hypothetical protein
MRIPVILISIALLTACASKKNAANQEPEVSYTPEQLLSSRPTIENFGVSKTEDLAALKGDPVTINSAGIKGDELVLDVSFRGLCTNHGFNLYHTGSYAESMPPQLGMVLYHNAQSDACETTTNKQLKFDLTSVRYGSSGKLIINLEGYEGQLVYEY